MCRVSRRRPASRHRLSAFRTTRGHTGTGFDCFDTLSHTADPRVRGAQRTNRRFLGKTLTDLGFVNLPEEWWHFTHRPEIFRDTRFDLPVARRSVAGR